MGFQHTLNRSTRAQISAAEDPRTEPHITVDAGITHGDNAVDEFCFAHTFHGLRPISAIKRAALRKHGLHDIVPGLANLVYDLLAKVHFLLEARIGLGIKCTYIPQVMVGVDNG